MKLQKMIFTKVRLLCLGQIVTLTEKEIAHCPEVHKSGHLAFYFFPIAFISLLLQ